MAERSELTVYYNGECPVCRHEIESYRRVADRHEADIAWRDITADAAALAEIGMSEDQAARRLHVADGTGRLLAGVDAFEGLWLALPGFRWLGRLVRGRAGRASAVAVYEGVLVPVLFWLHRRRKRRRQAHADRLPL